MNKPVIVPEVDFVRYRVAVKKNATVIFATIEENFVAFCAINDSMLLLNEGTHQLNGTLFALANHIDAWLNEEDYLSIHLLIQIEIKQVRASVPFSFQLFSLVFLLMI